MFWVQAVVCFLVWVGYGFVQSRRSDSLRQSLSAIPRSRRAGLAASLMVVSMGVLFGAFVIVANAEGFGPSGMKAWAWAVFVVIGLGFVHAITLATAMLVTLAIETSVTDRGGPASRPKEPNES